MSAPGSPPAGDDEAALLASFRAGEQGSAERLLLLHQPRLYRFALRLCGTPDDAADVLQDSLLAAARALRSFRGEASLSTWLFTIARRACLRKRRRRAGEPEALEPLPEAVADRRRSPEEDAAAAELARALEEALAELDPLQREALLLRDVEGLSTEEAARVVGVGERALKSRLHRGRLALRAALASRLGPPEAPPASGACPDVVRLFSRSLEGEVSPAVCARMERHLARCRRCTSVCESLRRTLAACRAAPLPAVPEGLVAALRRDVRRMLAG